MDVSVYDFPTVRDGPKLIEQAYCDLLIKYRNGETLPPEAIDWMDFANTILDTSDSWPSEWRLF
jgi:hypothetical protein